VAGRRLASLELKVLQRGNAFLACFFASSITIGLGEYLFPAIGFVRGADDMAYWAPSGLPWRPGQERSQDPRILEF
jgi:hypothetical protein